MFIRLIFPPGCHGLIQGSSTLKSVNTRVAAQSEGLPQIKLTKKKPNDLIFHQMILAEFNEIGNKKIRIRLEEILCGKKTSNHLNIKSNWTDNH